VNKPSKVSLSFDVDTISIWMGSPDATAFSRGEFGVVGTRRVLRLLKQHNILGTFFVPGLTAKTYPRLVEEIAQEGHEIAHHGNHHESPARLSREQERQVLEDGTKILEEITGKRPMGWRSPGWYVSENSLELLVEAGFSYDSSLMSHDVQISRCRAGDRWTKGEGVTFGNEVDLIEVPIAWHLDDFPWFEYIPPKGGNLTNPSAVLETWLGDLNYARKYEPGGTLTYTMHPQVIGRGHRMLMLEQLIEEIETMEDVQFTTIEAAASQWRKENPFHL
jgi:peptidoglycan/xylan/chitin deacetylase (PgdA/CDA1 family)